MSITNFTNKIKSKTSIDKTTVLFLFIIIGVGISSFALGRLSNNTNLNNSRLSASGINSQNILINQEFQNNEDSSISLKEKKYIASKNGKMYYPLNCGAAKRIKPENKLYFNSEDDAIKSGYVKSSMCK